MNDELVITAIAEKVILDNPKQVAQFKAGKTMLGFFVGQVLKADGSADPILTGNIFKRLLTTTPHESPIPIPTRNLP